MRSNTMFSGPPDEVSAPLAFETLPSQVTAGVPLNLTFLISPWHPSNQLTVQWKSNGSVRPDVRALPDVADPNMGTQLFRAQMPPLAPGELAEYSPVVTRAGLVVQALPVRSTRGTRPSIMPISPEATQASGTPAPRYEWTSEFLGAFTAQLKRPPESFGPGPDGMRITYHIESGEIRGPKINGKVRGGDWLILRHDGVGVAASRITYETDDGAFLLSQYSGIIDMGPDAYERALRNVFTADAPTVLTPQFITSHPNWLWLNRLQCLGVGRASMVDMVVRVDVYAIRAGQPLLPPACQA
jgi:hypothetical protein